MFLYIGTVFLVEEAIYFTVHGLDAFAEVRRLWLRGCSGTELFHCSACLFLSYTVSLVRLYSIIS